MEIVVKGEGMKKTPLNALHRQLGARMVEFGGWEMPVQYAGVITEHLAVRSAAGLFDVSHMGEIEVRGGKSLAFLQYATTNDVSALVDGQVQYTALCYPSGGVVDDLTLYRFSSEHFLLCVNAVNSDSDFDWLVELLRGSTFTDVMIYDRSADYVQLALQGPLSTTLLAQLSDVDLAALKYYHFVEGAVAGIATLISRTGYTGEDGFELYCPAGAGGELWSQLMAVGDDRGLQPVGLGARDTLRLEKGYALYGHEITQDIMPLEARLGWITKLGKKDFVGREVLLAAQREGLARRLIALTLDGAGVPRENYPVFCGERVAGYVTSGTLSPSLKRGIAMALIDAQAFDSDQPFEIGIRNRRIPAIRTSLPFV
jgi:aminomethyltransferase